MQRIYEKLIWDHFKEHNQMLFLAGPRQVGKTTIAKQWLETCDQPSLYINWDNQDHRTAILEGPQAIAAKLELDVLSAKPRALVFDEIHKYSHWKIFLKGFYDTYGQQCQIIVTGSAKLDVYQRGGDSLMGRYFLSRVHPLSVAECIGRMEYGELIKEPAPIIFEEYSQLYEFGGFPQPFIKHNVRFSNRWQQLRHHQLFREDIRDLSRINEIVQLEILAQLLQQQSGQLMNYSNLANKIRVSNDTIRRWLNLLEEVYFCFRLSPWSRNISRSLLKEPKIYLWDWSTIKDSGQRAENFIACHLLKATHIWTDLGFGQFELYFLRDKEQREVDFLVTRDDKPWFLVEAKKQQKSLHPALAHFQEQVKAEHAFQVVTDMAYIDTNCFLQHRPIVIPAITFLSQLV